MKQSLTLDNYKDILGTDDNNISFNYAINKFVLSDEFIRKFKEKLNWIKLSWTQPLSESIIREFQDRLNWTKLSWSQSLSETLIREFQNKVDWRHVSNEQTLTESFIREFSDKVNWRHLSGSQELSEPFIEEFADKVNWTIISYYQKLSKKFIEENVDRLYLGNLIPFQELSDEFCTKHNIKSNILKSVFHCGVKHRTIYRTKDEPDLINIGCFNGTKDEAIIAISKKYKSKERDDYISKVNKCFSV